MARDDGLTEFLATVTWSGTGRYEFLLYAVRPRDDPPFRPPALSQWPEDTRIHTFWLQDEPWPIVIELFEMRALRLPEAYDNALALALAELMQQGATLSWYMFDGVFGDISQLFEP